ncbi:acyl-CoA dehydrogenase C-terminal domain-containing protein [Haliea sp. E17]|uniref:acyl-CoA dehydrogenase C-terminal domain-containing protein n=1 Tax=Haliea sp. E17 TaxID=3401576 RepID=UPI003AAA567F
MPDYKAPLRDMRFAMYEVLDFENHYQALPGAADTSRELLDAVLEEAAKFAEQVVSPIDATGDREGCQWNEGAVTAPAAFRAAFDQFVESGWPALAQDPAWGGQGLPASQGAAFYEMLASASHAWSMYPSLTWGAIKTITAHAPEDLQQRYLPKLVSGRWSGTMCLTEAHCGSDLGLLRTRASDNGDGSYNISGSKIFISSGDHDMVDNIVHVVLARLPDAPEGVKGISLFLVPKLWVDEDGNCGEPNGVSCGSIEHKMGIHGNSTCVMNFDAARGYLISAPHKGMSAMFTFINESRLGVAQQAHGHIEASFQGALAYARERLQMRAPVRVLPDQPADPIIVHPDVRRMLLTQKAFAEGGRLLNYYCAKLVDIAHGSDDAESVQRAETELALLTPIAKGFITEAAMEATTLGVQVLGGHGYISEWGMEQRYRDARITAIYEGTNGIQALDLLGRKIVASGGAIMQPFFAHIDTFCRDDHGAAVAPLVTRLEAALALWRTLTSEVQAGAMQDPDTIGAASFDYLMLAGYTTLAYFLARGAAVASAALASGSSETDYYASRLAIANFYFQRILPRTTGLAESMRSGAANVMEVPAELLG